MRTNKEFPIVEKEEDCCECEPDMNVTYYWVSAIVAILLFVFWLVLA